jgi:hypothetical protein
VEGLTAGVAAIHVGVKQSRAAGVVPAERLVSETIIAH